MFTAVTLKLSNFSTKMCDLAPLRKWEPSENLETLP